MRIFPNFSQFYIETEEVKINIFKGGTGQPLLLLHGYPQTHLMWYKIAPLLAQDFTVIATDLRGYGDSSKPKGTENNYNYSKRQMARDQVEIMSRLGYDRFYLVGHDRGARVAHRLTLDYPEKVEKLAILDIIPTYDLYQTTDREFATNYYHWFFLIQPYPFPETLIAGNAEYFLRTCLQSWSKNEGAFNEEVIGEYLRCFTNSETIHATCEDYRAGASIDLENDRLDLEKKITCPVLILWGTKGIIGRKYNVIENWQRRAIDVIGWGINCGHFLPEESPQETYLALRNFLIGCNL
jgi:haloacetate dehalogenase